MPCRSPRLRRMYCRNLRPLQMVLAARQRVERSVGALLLTAAQSSHSRRCNLNQTARRKMSRPLRRRCRLCLHNCPSSFLHHRPLILYVEATLQALRTTLFCPIIHSTQNHHQRSCRFRSVLRPGLSTGGTFLRLSLSCPSSTWPLRPHLSAPSTACPTSPFTALSTFEKICASSATSASMP